MDPIANKGWGKFVQHPEPAVVPVIHEFYANVAEHQNFKVFVRGKMVPFDRSTINKYYELLDIENDEYHSFYSSHNFIVNIFG